MTRDRQLLLVIGLLVFASLAALYYFIDGPRTALDGEKSPSAIADDGIAEIDFGRARRHDEAAAPAAEAAAPSAAIADHVPRLGPELFTGDALAEFEIRDARDQVLPASAGLRAELYRIESGARIHEGVVIETETGLVRCVGAAGGGLEPGRYAMKLHAGPYGALWKDFDLARGQRYRESIRLECYTRVIKLRFVDAEGRALPRLANAPVYDKAENAKVADRDIARGPGLLLREPPGDDGLIGIGGGSGGAGGSTGARRGPTAQATLDGCWFLQVAAGREGRLSIRFTESRDGISSFSIKSSFLEPEWDDYVIRLDPNEEHLARLSRYPLENPDDPGHQSDLVVPRPAETEIDPHEFDQTLAGSWGRLLLQGPGIAQLELKVQQGPRRAQSLRHMGRRYIDRRARVAEGTWFTDVKIKAGEELSWYWHDGALLETAPRTLPAEEFRQASCLVEKTDSFAVLPFRLVLAPISPTLDAWARAMSVNWSKHDWPGDGASRRWTIKAEDELAIKTCVVRDDEGRGQFGSSLMIDLRGDARWSRTEMHLPWTDAMSVAAETGEVTIKPRPRGLALRFVDEEDRVLPWVEGSIMELDRLPLAERVRAVLAEAGINLEVQTPFLAENLDRQALEALTEGSDLASVRAQVSDQVWEALADQEARLMVARNGAWYDSRRKFRGDDRGYLIDLDQKLIAGQRYVLWLWSRSRDAYKPDRMLVFTAAEGLTDLGLVTLPRWRKD